MSKSRSAKEGGQGTETPLALFACPNPDCDVFNQFDAANLSVCERMGKDKSIRRLYCNHCGHRFSEREGSLLEYTKRPMPAVVRILKCLGHGCCVEATADICEVDPRTVERMLRRAGQRADHFHRLQLEKLPGPPQAVQLDEMHGRVCQPPAKKGATGRSPSLGLPNRVGAWVRRGFTSPWRSPPAS